MGKKISKNVLLAVATIVATALIIWIQFFDKNGIIIKKEFFDWDENGIKEEIFIKKDILTVEKDGIVIFKTPTEETVTDFEIGDVNNDREIELTIGFWRIGDYGTESLPYLKSRRGDKLSYHLFIYQYIQKAETFRLIWGSSTLPHPIYDFEIMNNNESNFLNVTEGSYDDFDKYGKIKPIQESNWIWNEWWFEEI